MDYQEEIQKLLHEIEGQGYESICFWLPAYNTGGGTYYLCEMAKYLQMRSDFKIYYMDFLNGYPSQLLKDTGVTILEYRDEDDTFPVDEKCIVMTNSTRAIMLKKMRPDNKLLFWHYETVPCDWDALFIMNEGKAFLELCNKKSAMMFHDWSSWDILSQECGRPYEKSYLPLIMPPKAVRAVPNLKSENEIHLVWLGRLGKEKIQSIFCIIDNFAAYQTKRKKIMHIVGDGWNRNEVEQYCKKYSNCITFSFPGTVPQYMLDQYLLEHADITFAMGLSVLESAALGIPTAVVKLDTKPIKDNQFFWLFDSKEYCVGILPSQSDRFDISYSSFEDMMDAMYVFEQYKSIGEKCFHYFAEILSDVNVIIFNFLTAVKNDALTMDDLERCIHYIPYNHIRVRKTILLGKTIATKVVNK